MHYLKKKPTRRDFLKLTAMATMGMATPFSAMNRFKSINHLMSPAFSEYKAIVCLFLGGGNDSFNMLMPRSGSAYTEYQNARSNLALDAIDMHSIEAGAYGLHPSMTDVHQMYLDGELALISNAGSLIEPVTKQQYLDKSVPLPLGLFSHLDQFNHFQTAQPGTRTNIGWGGRIADLISQQNGNQLIPMNLSLSGSNIFQYGLQNSEFSMSSSGPVMPTNWDATWGHNDERRAALDSMLHTDYADMFMSTYNDIFRNSVEAGEEFKDAIENAYNFTTDFSSNSVSQNFEMIAKTISVREDLDFQRQIFWVRYGGWDHHEELLFNHNNTLSVVNDAMSEFNSALKEIGMFGDVTTFVMSEFGRRLPSNGNGTDHAWGGNMAVMGGDVNGGMYGTYPSLSLDNDTNPLLIHSGTLIPDTAMDSMFAELAMWYGLDSEHLATLFPNLGNFHDIGSLNSGNPPIGFMQLT